jgi:hypothetical protein
MLGHCRKLRVVACRVVGGRVHLLILRSRPAFRPSKPSLDLAAEAAEMEVRILILLDLLLSANPELLARAGQVGRAEEGNGEGAREARVSRAL